MKEFTVKLFLYLLFFALGVVAQTENNAWLKASAVAEAKESYSEQLNESDKTNYEPRISIFDDPGYYYAYNDFHYEVEVVKYAEKHVEEENKTVTRKAESQLELTYMEIELEEIEVMAENLFELPERPLGFEISMSVEIPETLIIS